jgi:hypothetical protein
MYSLSIFVANYDDDFTFVQKGGDSIIPAGRTLVYVGEKPLDAYNAFVADIDVRDRLGMVSNTNKVTEFQSLFFRELRNYMIDHERCVLSGRKPFYYKATPGEWDFLFVGAQLSDDLTFSFEFKGNYDSIKITCERI